jgi:catechol 2,3-dioxygenase-like lactoylglutathione lyase family enzyme
MSRRASLGLDHISLLLTDLDEGVRFFHFLLGFPLLAKIQRDDEYVAVLRAGRVNIEIWQRKPGKDGDCKAHLRNPRFLNHLAFEVRELDDLLADIVQAGYEVIDDIFEPTDGVREAVVKGPDGIRCKLIEQNITRLIWRSFSGRLKREEDEKHEQREVSEEESSE